MRRVLGAVRVEDYVTVPIFEDFDRAALCLRASGCESCCIMGARSKTSERLFKAGLSFRVLDLVRTDRGVWARELNAASLPLGCLSSKAWLRRLRQVSILKPVDAGRPWFWKGRAVTNSVLVCFEVSSEIVNGGFSVNSIGVDLPFDGMEDATEDLGDLSVHASDEPRTEIVMETTVDDARRIRKLESVKHISQRRGSYVGQGGAEFSSKSTTFLM